jgi:thiamine-monophosphate kinase
MDSEFDFISHVLDYDLRSADVVVPNGDDAAVVRIGQNLVAISVDSVVEGTHFTFELSSPAQVGAKAVESAISDIIAMGGTARSILASITTPRMASIERLKEVFGGIKQSCIERGVIILGGDTTTGGDALTISITAIGDIADETQICRRSDAKEGDLIYVSGPLGGSAAGLLALQHNLPGLHEVKRRHLEPRCRADLAGQIGARANALIDISDGLSSEIHHICRASRVGAIVYEDAIPLHPEVVDVAKHLRINPLKLAWDGGEDYELLFTVPRERIAETTINIPGTVIGEITAPPRISARCAAGERIIQPGGYDHFSRGKELS